MFNFEKMTKSLSHDERYEINQGVLLQETKFQKDAYDKLPEIIAKHNLGKPLSMDDLYTIARKIFRIFGRSNERTLSTNFLNACAELLFASKAEFKEKQDNLMLLFVDEIINIPFHPTSSEPTANKILKHFIDANKVDDTNRDDFLSAIHLLMKFFTRHGDYCINSSLNVEVSRFKIYVQPYPYDNRMIDFFLFRNWHQHDKYIDVMRPRPPIKSLIQFCEICKIDMSTPDFMDSKMFPTIENLVLLIVKEGIKCTCWEKFVEANPGRNIQPCSAKGCDGSLCPFCDQYKEMQFMEFIAVINDSFKKGSLKEDVYNDLFDTICQIIIGGSDMPVMPLTSKLVLYLSSMSIELFQELLSLIEKFEVFFRRIKSIRRPKFLSTPNLRDFTIADYKAYMDELKLGQDQFETVIPKIGFCCCNENIKYRDEINARQERIDKNRHEENVGALAVNYYKRSMGRC
jgi:hypothetical protein